MAVSLSIAIAENDYSIVNNSSDVTVRVNLSWTGGSYNRLNPSGWVKIDGQRFNFSSVFNENETNSGSQTLFTITLDIPHNDNGEKTLSCSASFDSEVSSGVVTASASKVLTTIPRKSTLSVSNGTLGTSLQLSVTKKAPSFTHTITYKCGTATGTVCTKSNATSVTWNTNNGNTLDLSSQNTKGTSVSVTFTITTYSGNTNVGSNTATITMSIPYSVVPSCTISVKDATGYADTYGGFIKGISKLEITITPKKAYGSDISKYTTTVDGVNYSKSSFTTSEIRSSKLPFTIKSTVTDDRNRSGSASKNISILDYTPPIVNTLSVQRCNSDGTENDRGEYVKAEFSATVSSLGNKNSASYRLEYKKSVDSKYESHNFTEYSNIYTVLNGSFIFEADSSASYDIRLIATDNFKYDSKTASASTGFTLMHWMHTGMAMAIGKMSEINGVFDIGLRTRFFGGILHPTLEPETDLDDVRTPNTYVGENISTHNYLNCPLDSGTFTLVVNSAGETGQVHQILTQCNKANPVRYERFYYSSSWGGWMCTSDFKGKLLWSGEYYMSASQTATLVENVSAQKTGIVLVFSRYSSGTAQDYHFQTFFVPKLQVSNHPGCGHTFFLTTDGSFSGIGSKYLYINDANIVGNDINKSSGTANGITYNNAGFVLRHVIGV